jgi:DNA-binding YbaB/EbfC family protein
MKNIGDIMKQAQQLQAKMQEVQDRLDAAELEGTSGGGLVRLILNGKGVMKRVTIDPSLLKPEEAAIVEDLIVAAHNDAKSKLERYMQDEMGKVAGGLPLPPGFKLPF